MRRPTLERDGIGLLISYSTVYGGRWPAFDDLTACLEPYCVSGVVLTLAWILATTESWLGVRNNERELSIRRHFVPDLRYNGRGKDERFLFSRATLLWLMRQAFRICPTEGANVDTVDAHRAIGNALMIANDLAAFREPRSLTTDLELAANLLPTTEYLSHEEFDRDMSRTHFMLMEVAPVASNPAVRELPGTIERLIGFSLNEYRDLVLASAFRVMLADPSEPMTYITPALTPHDFNLTSVEPNRYREFWDSISWDAQSAAEHFRASQSPVWDLTALRNRPLLRVRSDDYAVLDLPFLLDKAGRGLFWTALGHSNDRAERDLMLCYWGELFESYVGFVLDQVKTPTRQVLLDPQFDDEAQAADCCVLEDRTLIAIEVKVSTISASVRYADNPELLRDEIAMKFVAGDGSGRKGLSQLARFLERFAKGHLIRDRNGVAVSRHDVGKIIPVLVHIDTALRNARINHYMADRLREMVRVKRPIVTPIVLLPISELEEMQGQLDEFRLCDLLESYLSTLPSDRTAMFFASRIPLLDGRERKPGPVLRNFDSLLKQTVARLFPDSDVNHLRTITDGTIAPEA